MIKSLKTIIDFNQSKCGAKIGDCKLDDKVGTYLVDFSTVNDKRRSPGVSKEQEVLQTAKAL
jgi:hypothetical protein